MRLTNKQITNFQNTVLDFYREQARSFPWRNHTDPYAVLVSEVMLQQTQVSRVITKFAEFMDAFPNWNTLSQSALSDVLRVWQGMGYNRRAKALRDIAQRIVSEHNGKLPADPKTLQTLPWIGPHTAGSICAFAFNMPTVFIETNIRTVFIHHFFPQHTNIHDKDIYPLVEQTVYTHCPRDWYSGLMDYGTHIKSLHPNPSRKSIHHTKQSKFEGSNRHIRGMILKQLAGKPHTKKTLQKHIDIETPHLNLIITQLISEGMIEQIGQTLHIAQ